MLSWREVRRRRRRLRGVSRRRDGDDAEDEGGGYRDGDRDRTRGLAGVKFHDTRYPRPRRRLIQYLLGSTH